MTRVLPRLRRKLPQAMVTAEVVRRPVEFEAARRTRHPKWSSPARVKRHPISPLRPASRRSMCGSSCCMSGCFFIISACFFRSRIVPSTNSCARAPEFFTAKRTLSPRFTSTTDGVKRIASDMSIAIVRAALAGSTGVPNASSCPHAAHAAASASAANTARHAVISPPPSSAGTPDRRIARGGTRRYRRAPRRGSCRHPALL